MTVLARLEGAQPISGTWRVRRTDQPTDCWVLEKWKAGRWGVRSFHETRDRLIREVEHRISWGHIEIAEGALSLLANLPPRPLPPPPIGAAEQWLRDRSLIVHRKPIAITGCAFFELVISPDEAARRINRDAGFPKKVCREQLAGQLIAAGILMGVVHV